MTVGNLMEFARKNQIPKSKKPIKKIIEDIDKGLWGIQPFT